MSEGKNFHMTPEEFRRHGHAAIDWIADYYARVEDFPVLSRVDPGQIRASLPAEPPQEGESFAKMLADVEKLILPGVTHWQSPNFFAYFPSNASGPAILGDLLASGLGVQGMLWATSPACTELETHVLDWLAQMLDLPSKFLSSGSGGGVIQDTASSASLCALLAARERATDFASNQRGSDGKLVSWRSRSRKIAAPD
jgi:aromatic-L-amino-acid/L-tryptophan decarboxylase